MSNAIQVRYTKNHMNLDNIKEGIVRVGFFEGSKYEGGKTVASVARYNEFGLGVPRRSFMRPAVHANKSQLTARLRSEYTKALKDNSNTMDVLDTFGLLVKGFIQNQIINTNYPPNAPSTIKKKGFNAPLRDTKLMLHSVAHQTEEVIK